MDVDVIPASPEQRPIVANLLELYSHDFSEVVDLTLGSDGRFGYEDLTSYWTDSTRHPFLVRADGRLAGFVFVRKGSEISSDPDIWDMTEFFVVRGFRRLGLGTRIAGQIWDRFPGKWEVRVIDRHRNAKEFWQHAVSTFLGKTADSVLVDKNGEAWRVFSFTV